MLPSHFLKAQDFSAQLGLWGRTELSWQAKQRHVFLPRIQYILGLTVEYINCFTSCCRAVLCPCYCEGLYISGILDFIPGCQFSL